MSSSLVQKGISLGSTPLLLIQINKQNHHLRRKSEIAADLERDETGLQRNEDLRREIGRTVWEERERIEEGGGNPLGGEGGRGKMEKEGKGHLDGDLLGRVEEGVLIPVEDRDLLVEDLKGRQHHLSEGHLQDKEGEVLELRGGHHQEQGRGEGPREAQPGGHQLVGQELEAR